jgi:hypothetical protein
MDNPRAAKRENVPRALLLVLLVVIIAAVAFRLAIHSAWPPPERDRFYWEDPPVATERENFAGSFGFGPGFGPRKKREGYIGGAVPCPTIEQIPGPVPRPPHGGPSNRENFSPDAPGTCPVGCNRAAEAEIDALRVAAGL